MTRGAPHRYGNLGIAVTIQISNTELGMIGTGLSLVRFASI